jgi:hypothetical protein
MGVYWREVTVGLTALAAERISLDLISPTCITPHEALGAMQGGAIHVLRGVTRAISVMLDHPRAAFLTQRRALTLELHNLQGFGALRAEVGQSPAVP